MVQAGLNRLGGQGVVDGLGEGRAHIGGRDPLALVLEGLHVAGHRRLQTGEGEVVAVPPPVLGSGQAAGEADGVPVPLLGEPVDVRTAGVGQAEQPADLVEGLTGGVVEGAAELDDVGGDVLDVQEAGVPSGDDEADEALGQGAIHQLIHRQVPDDVVDAVDGPAQAGGQGLGGADAHGERADETGTGAHGDDVDVVQIHARAIQSRVEGGQEGLQVGARGELGNDAAETGVGVHGSGDDVPEELAAAHERRARLVAGGLDAQDQCLTHAHSLVPDPGPPDACGETFPSAPSRVLLIIQMRPPRAGAPGAASAASIVSAVIHHGYPGRPGYHSVG